MVDGHVRVSEQILLHIRSVNKGAQLVPNVLLEDLVSKDYIDIVYIQNSEVNYV
jgi:hypothetical protein